MVPVARAWSVPASSDERWRGWAKPLVRWLGTGKTWPQILEWIESRGQPAPLMRNVVAWAETEGLAKAYQTRRGWVWRRVGAVGATILEDAVRVFSENPGALPDVFGIEDAVASESAIPGAAGPIFPWDLFEEEAS